MCGERERAMKRVARAPPGVREGLRKSAGVQLEALGSRGKGEELAPSWKMLTKQMPQEGRGLEMEVSAL